MSNFVLVHGGMLGGWCWKKVRPYLEKHKVLTPTLTGLGERKHLAHPDVDLETHIADIINTILFEELEEVILVGHSYGGMVITGVADRIPQKIKGLLYLDALLPQNNESMFDIVDPQIASYLTDRAQGGWEVLPTLPSFDNREDEEWFQALSTPHPLKSFQQRLKLRGAAVKKAYIKCTQDHALDSMATRAEELGVPTYWLDSGHFPMVTHPQQLADLFIRIHSN